MSRRNSLPVVCLALAALTALPGALAADAATTPRALVTETRLRQGSLPSVLDAYGIVRGSNTGSRAIMAFGPAVVGQIETHLGTAVRAGEPLLTLMPSPDSAAAYSQAKSSLQVAEALVQSTDQLVKLHLATREQLAQADKARTDAQASLRALAAAGAAGPKVLRAPFAAVVTALPVHTGDLVSAGTPLLTLASPDRLVLAAGVVPALAGRVHVGDVARVRAGEAGRWVSGHVVASGAAIDPNTGLVPVEIALPGGFLPGEFAEARITTAQVHGYVVPHEAILINDSGGTYVVQAINGVAHKVPVKMLDADGELNVISGALDPHAPLVLTGNYQLDEGMPVELAAAAGGGAAQ